MKKEYDFSKGKRGKFYYPKVEFNFPIYLEEDIAGFIGNLANEKEMELSEIVNDWLRRSIGLIEFSKGKDGGRDGKFTGRANKFPSEREPWKGKFIIQSKYTENPIATCSDSDFQNKIQKEEIPKLKKLKANNELDNYLLFTNRRLSGVKGTELVTKIKNEVGIGNVEIIGKENINRYLSEYKYIDRLKIRALHTLPDTGFQHYSRIS